MGWRIAIAIAACWAVLTMAAARAPTSRAHSDEAELAISFSLSSASVCQYEPVILNYRITNNTDTTVRVYLVPDDLITSLGLQCIGPDGRPAPRVKPLVLPRRLHVLISAGTHVSPRRPWEEPVVLSRSFDTSRSGTYTLYIDTKLPWIADDDSAAGVLVFSDSITFEVGPADPQRLLHIMSTLVRTALDSRGGPGIITVQTLFSIPEVEALPMWHAFMEQAAPRWPHAIEHVVIPELVRMGTPGKADLLAELAWGRYRTAIEEAWPPPAEIEIPAPLTHLLPPMDYAKSVPAKARFGLLNMYWGGDARLREHIRSLFVTHEGAMPEVKRPIVPLN